MFSTCRTSARAAVAVRELLVISALSCAWCITLCIPQDAVAQSTVPRPPDAQKQQSRSVPHPPDSPKQQTTTDNSDQPSTTFKVNVKLVNVFTTVTNSGGVPVLHRRGRRHQPQHPRRSKARTRIRAPLCPRHSASDRRPVLVPVQRDCCPGNALHCRC